MWHVKSLTSGEIKIFNQQQLIYMYFVLFQYSMGKKDGDWYINQYLEHKKLEVTIAHQRYRKF